MHRYVRYGLIGIGLLALWFTAGFYFQWPWATALWPWPDSRLSYIFIASITAAIALPIIWIGLSGEAGAMIGGALNLGVMSAGIALYLFQLYGTKGDQKLLIFTLGFLFFALLNLGIIVWANRYPMTDTRPTPTLVRVSFAVFAIGLILVGLALVTRSPVVFPWALNSDSSVLFGWIFLGAALYFIYGVARPLWHNARGQLMGFLAYDLVLILPFVALLGNTKPEFTPSLILYLIVILYSGALAIYYLLINKETRTWTTGV